jgi:hypothetical protein
MSKFTYKGRDIIGNVIVSGTGAVPGYNFTSTTPSYNGLKPNDFGFSYQGVSVRNSCTAPTSALYTANGSVDVPEGCNAVSIMAVGGQGGTGGKGGEGTSVPVRLLRSHPGGDGGDGGGGTTIYTTQFAAKGTINFSIGTKGTTGAGGVNQGGLPSNGKGGDKGASGNATVITISSGNSYTAPGGDGGFGGNGGQGNNTESGNKGASGGTPGSAYPNPETYPSLGGNGRVQFIFFYS